MVSVFALSAVARVFGRLKPKTIKFGLDLWYLTPL